MAILISAEFSAFFPLVHGTEQLRKLVRDEAVSLPWSHGFIG